MRKGIAQVAREAAGHLARFFIKFAAEFMPIAVRLIFDDDDALPRAQLEHRFAHIRRVIADVANKTLRFSLQSNKFPEGSPGRLPVIAHSS